VGQTQTDNAYFLLCHQQVLVHVGAQEACVAITFHQFVDVVLNGKRRGGKRKRHVGYMLPRASVNHSETVSCKT